MSRRRSTQPQTLSPVLMRLIEAAEQHGEDAEGRDITGAAQALREFGAVAHVGRDLHRVVGPRVVAGGPSRDRGLRRYASGSRFSTFA